MGTLLQYAVRRILAAIPTVIGVVVIVFLMVRLIPGDPARIIAGVLAEEEDVERIRQELGLDKPLHIQFFIYVTKLLQGDLGISARTREPVIVEIAKRLPYTIQLAVISIVIAAAIGIVAGVISAKRQYSKLDYAVTASTLFGISMPVYWLGLMLILLFAVNLKVLPAAGADEPLSFLLPSLTLAAFSTAFIVRMTRASMLEVLRQDFIRTAMAKGLRERLVIYKHALKNALIPVITIIGLLFGNLLGGAILTETIFAWPGIGRLLVESIFARDYPMIQGIILIFSLMYIFVNLVVDILYSYIDPRVRYD